MKAYIKGYNLFNRSLVDDIPSANCTERYLSDDRNVIIAKGNASEGSMDYGYSTGWVSPFRATKRGLIQMSAGDVVTVSADFTLIEQGNRTPMVRCYLYTEDDRNNIAPANQKKITTAKQRLSWNFTIAIDKKYMPVFPINSNKVQIENIMITPLEHSEKPYDNGRIRVKAVMLLLPKEYQEVEYIESTGTQYIDTGVSLKENLFYDITFKHNSTGGLYGRYVASNDNIVISQAMSPNRLVVAYGFVSNSPQYVGAEVKNAYDIHNVKIIDGKIVIDGEVAAENKNAKLQNSSEPFYLFRQSSIYGYGRIYHAKLYVGNTIIRNFIPCYRKSDGEVGLYDTVNGKFYGNDGTGVFSKGKDKTTLQKCNIFIKE